MPTATFEARAVYPPEANGRKSYKILGSDGENYFVRPADGAGLEKGTTYEAFYEENDFKGKMLRMVQRISPSTQTNGAVNRVMETAQGPYPGSMLSYPKPATGVGDRDKNRHIFVCGAINNALQGSGLEAFNSRDMLRAAIDNLVRAYDTSLLANPQKDADMDDEIPM